MQVYICISIHKAYLSDGLISLFAKSQFAKYINVVNFQTYALAIFALKQTSIFESNLVWERNPSAFIFISKFGYHNH